MTGSSGRLSLNASVRANRWQQWVPAAAVSVALHVALVPGVVDYVAGSMHVTSNAPAPMQAELELEQSLPREPALPVVEILEPPEDPPEMESSPVHLPAAPEILQSEVASHPQLAMNDIRFPESAFGERLVAPHVATHPEGRGDPPGGSAESTAESPQTVDTSPLAPIFPAEPPPQFLDGLPAAAVRLGTTRMLFGERAEAELRRRVYANTYYPEAAADLDVEGVVIVGFRIDAKGQPADLSVTNAESCHPILQEEALAMVRGGAPYPVPEHTRDVDVTVALAYLNTPDAHAERIRMLLSSGAAGVDQQARQMAAQDATLQPELGWHLALYRVSSRISVKPGEKVVSPRLESFTGDARLKRVFVESLPQLLPLDDGGAHLKIPIQFRILDP